VQGRQRALAGKLLSDCGRPGRRAEISNLYYPASNRSGAGLTFENALIGTGERRNLKPVFQEFVVRKLTPHLPNYSANNRSFLASISQEVREWNGVNFSIGLQRGH